MAEKKKPAKTATAQAWKFLKSKRGILVSFLTAVAIVEAENPGTIQSILGQQYGPKLMAIITMAVAVTKAMDMKKGG